MICVPAPFLYRGATIVSVFNWKMKDEKKRRFALVEKITGEKFRDF